MVSRDLPISPPVQALHFGLADWVSTPAPRQLTPNKLSRLLCLVTFSRSTVEIVHCEEKTEKTQRIGIRTLAFYPNGDNRTIRPPGRGGT